MCMNMRELIAVEVEWEKGEGGGEGRREGGRKGGREGGREGGRS